MAYTPPDRHALTLRLSGVYTPPDRHALGLRLNPNRISAATAQAQSASASGAQVFQRAATAQAQSTSAAGRYRPPVKRYLSRRSDSRYCTGTPLDERHPLPWARSTTLDARNALPHATGTQQDERHHLPWAHSTNADARRDLAESAARPVALAESLPWREALSRDQRAAAHWQLATPQHGRIEHLPWRTALPRDRFAHLHWLAGTPHSQSATLPWSAGQVGDLRRQLPWGMAIPVPYGGLHALLVIIRPPVVVPPPCYVPPARHGVHFRLTTVARDTPLSRHALAFVLSCQRGRVFDLRSTLHMSHSLSVIRLPDGLPLAVTRVSLAADRDSWGWTMQLSFADAASLIAVEPTTSGTTSIQITVDGHTWVGEVDSYTESRQLNQRRGSVTARSRTVQLGGPHAPERSFTNASATTAQQLAAAELQFTGYTLDWRIPDWPLPAGVYSADRTTPLATVIAVASAAGAMVQSALATDTLIVAPRYPDAPWALASVTPDFALGGGSWLSTGKRWVAGASYNGVYVSGRDQGVLARVYREGTSGSPYAPMVVDVLITDASPARGRGIEVIASSLPRHEIPIELPLRHAGQAPGLLLPGELGELLDTVWGTYRAVVDRVEITAEVSTEGLVTARQRASLWRVLE